MMLHTKYQGSMPSGVDKKIFSCFPYILAYVKHMTPGWDHFWSKGHNLNKLVRCLLVDATYQISRL